MPDPSRLINSDEQTRRARRTAVGEHRPRSSGRQARRSWAWRGGLPRASAAPAPIPILYVVVGSSSSYSSLFSWIAIARVLSWLAGALSYVAGVFAGCALSWLCVAVGYSSSLSVGSSCSSSSLFSWSPFLARRSLSRRDFLLESFVVSPESEETIPIPFISILVFRDGSCSCFWTTVAAAGSVLDFLDFCNAELSRRWGSGGRPPCALQVSPGLVSFDSLVFFPCTGQRLGWDQRRQRTRAATRIAAAAEGTAGDSAPAEATEEHEAAIEQAWRTGMNLNLVELPTYCSMIVVVEHLVVPGRRRRGAGALQIGPPPTEAVLSLAAQRTIHNMLEAADGVFSSWSAFTAMNAGRQRFSLSFSVSCLYVWCWELSNLKASIGHVQCNAMQGPSWQNRALEWWWSAPRGTRKLCGSTICINGRTRWTSTFAGWLPASDAGCSETSSQCPWLRWSRGCCIWWKMKGSGCGMPLDTIPLLYHWWTELTSF